MNVLSFLTELLYSGLGNLASYHGSTARLAAIYLTVFLAVLAGLLWLVKSRNEPVTAAAH
ncbi:MAG: hypothetical protein JW730_14170 [Anaerolineales bacterium]|nr:hypothetical protein [Anaerolineales bacterium]